jgi:acetyltransferase
MQRLAVTAADARKSVPNLFAGLLSMTIRNLDALLAPRSIALIGATERPGSVGATVARNLLEPGFAGPVYFVNPSRSSILGNRCYASVTDLPDTPDLAVIVTPAATVPGLVGELAERGTRAIAAITAGLDASQKQQMLDAGRSRLVRVLGPNIIGLMLPKAGINATFAHRAALPGDVAFLSQSGALVTAVIDWASDRHIGFSHVLSLGDMADVDFGDLLDYLAGDTSSRAILIYMEALTNAAKFMSAARRAARVKPVIAIKAGRNAAAARAAASHTGRLAGRDAAYDAAFRRAGVLRVNALDELFDAAEMLARVPRLGGERLIVLTNGGGAGVLAADHLADEGGTLAELLPETKAALDRVLPPTWSKGNPVDIIGDAGPDRYAQALEILLADRSADAILAINCPTSLSSSTEIANRVVETHRASRAPKPVITNWLGDGAAAQSRSVFSAAGIPTFETPRAAIGGFMQLVRHGRAQDELMRTPPAMPPEEKPDDAVVSSIISAALKSGRSILSEAEGKDILAAYGVPVIPSVKVAATPAAAREAAASMLPRYASVVLKILSDDISHKSDVGGVKLDLMSTEAVETAAADMLQRICTLKPDARIEGFTMSAMVRRPRAHELIVGMSVDETFGPLVMFGAGGTSVEVVADTSLALPPLDMKLARDLIERTRVSRLLIGYRDRKPADLDAIAHVLVKISAVVCQHPEIREIDVNPLLADENGVIALDARVRVADQTKDPRPPLSIKPYPREWERNAALTGLGELLLRPIRPEDEALYPAFLPRVTQEDMRLRLFAPHKSLSHRFLARMTQIDYAREIAFVALSRSTGELLGVSRFSADPDYVRAEYAIIVRSDLKGKGLGWLLMQQLIDYAGATGIREIFGSVLTENTGMLKMCRELGFKVEHEPDDESVRLVTLSVPPVRG